MNIIASSKSAPRQSRVLRRKPSPLALEQRFMFDGAAVDHAIDTVDAPAADASATSHDAPAAALIEVTFSDANLEAAAVLAQEAVRQYLDNATDAQLFALFNGGRSAPDAEWTERLSNLREGFDSGSFTLDVVAMDSSSQFTAVAAFADEGPDGTPTIFVNTAWFAMFDAPDAERALVEEVGHAIDAYLNPNADTAGDEGDAFAAAVVGVDTRSGFALGVEAGQVAVDGVSYDVEFASFKFVNAYQMITDVDGDGVVDNFENWAEKEQETHTLLIGDTSSNSGGLGAVTITDTTAVHDFSGNDVSAVGLSIGGQDYYGWVSRPLKVQGRVVAFYFWTDQDFSDLSQAQIDGNQDNDTADFPADPGVTDNKGFILVVDQSYFTGLINAGTTPLAVAASSVWSAVSADTYNTIEVKSSSDRVDSALNNLLGAATTPAALVATADGASGTPGTSGGAALEQGGDANSPSLNTQTAGGNLTDTVNATGNVLTNDVNSDGRTPLGVTGVSSNGTNESASVTAAAAGVVTGRYGTLTLNADGSYTYVIDNTNAAVDALLPASTPLQDVFTYTVNDGVGGTASTTLTIQIKGADDAPVAADDYNTAKESLLTDGSAYSGSDTVGAKATGDVTLNDADVDHTEAQKTIVGLDETGAATAGTYTASSASTTLNFSTSTNINSVNVGNFVFWDHDGTGSSGTKPVALAVSNGAPTPTYTFVTVTSMGAGAVAGTTDFTLSATPTHYWNGSSWAAFSDVTTQLAGGTRYFEFGSANGNVAANSAKGGTLTANGVDTVVSVDITGASGSIYEGMTVTALDGGTSVLPAGTVITKVNYGGGGNITSIELSNDFSPKPANPSGYALSFSMPTGGDTTITTAYGTLELCADGTYTYTPIADNPLLSAGQTFTESFDYVMQDALGAKSAATLYITVIGSGINDPVADNDTITATEAGGGANGTAGTDPSASASPNRLIDNDTTNLANFPNKSITGVTSLETGNSAAPAVNSAASTPGTSPAAVLGKYGTFTVGADGSYIYTVDNTNPAVEALRTSGQTLTESFSYVVKNADAGNTTTGGLDTAVVTVTIQGANDAPVAADDIVTAAAGAAAPTGNVLNNDRDVDAGDTKTVTFAQAGTTATPGAPVAGATAIVGTYGTLTINPNGTYTYVVDTANAAVQALAAGATATETFSYQMKDTAGATSVAKLSVTVTGRNDAPVNAYPASVTGAVNTPIAFTGGNLVSVADVDGNLQSVTLHVDHGTLTASGSGGTISGAGTADLVITGTQAEINAILASLAYTPATGFSGADFLTILSQDSQAAYDSDGFAINIPTAFAGPTVKESDLANGTDPTDTEETASTTLAAPAGQNFGGTTQSGTDTYGTWTLTTSGVFTYTLTGAPGVSAPSSTRTVPVVTYDQFGNATSNPVTVTIVDDGPVAVADTNTALDGGTAVTGNVLTDDTDDAFGADGPKAGGGVVGVRAAGGDTTTAVVGGPGNAITGQYGTLTLDADGSYTYTPANSSLVSSVGDVFVYTIEDADGSRATTTLTITVQPSGSPTADLSITKAVDASAPALNGEVIYTLVVANAGTSAATNVRVIDELPAGLSFRGASLDGTNWDTDGSGSMYVVDPSGNDIWSVGTLASGASRTLYIKAAVISTAVITNTASVTSDTYDPNSANNTDSGTDGNQTVTAVAPITVTGGAYNENSPRAIFTVTAASGQPLSFDVRDVADPGKAPTGDNEGGAGDSLDTAPLYYSLDGGSTWHRYTGTPVTAGAVPVLVAVDIAAERDAVYEGEERFQLVVNPGQPNQAADYASIFDDGTGTITDPIDETTTNSTGSDTGAPKNDDRPAASPEPPPPQPPTPVDPPQPAPLPPVPEPTPPVASNAPLQFGNPEAVPFASPTTRTLVMPASFETGLRDAYTSRTGFPIVVIDGTQSALTIYRGVADQYAERGGTSSFAVPFDAFAHTNPNERIVLSANLADGRNLPTWVAFDAQSGKFTVTPPRTFTGELKIKVTARDSQGREINTLFRFSVGEQRSEAESSGRQAFSTQLRAVGQKPIPKFVALNAATRTN